MDEFLMYKYLNGKGANSRDEQDFMEKFKRFMKIRRSSMRRDDLSMDDDWWGEDNYKLNSYGSRDDDWNYPRMNRYIRNSMSLDNITEEQAIDIVSLMYHIHNGRKHLGEKYDMHKAKEICSRYKGIIPSHIKYPEIYVAINAQYHDYCDLFKSWFGDNIDSKIVESAISFWFKDVDYTKGNKVMEYFDV